MSGWRSLLVGSLARRCFTLSKLIVSLAEGGGCCPVFSCAMTDDSATQKIDRAAAMGSIRFEYRCLAVKLTWALIALDPNILRVYRQPGMGYALV